MTMPSPLWAQAQARPQHIALVCGDTTLRYRQWADAAWDCAAELSRTGVGAGMRVAVVGTASIPLAVRWFALHALGAVPVPMAPLLTDDEVAQRCLATGAVAILRQVASGDSFSLHWRPAPEPTAAGAGPQPAPAGAPPTAGPVQPPRAAPSGWPLGEVAVVFSTSGSTGDPKAVPLTALQLLSSAFCVASRLGHSPGDAWLACLPWHHVGGAMILYRTVLLGAQAHIVAPFDPDNVARTLDDGQASLAAMVPVMLERVLNARAQTPFPARLRALVLGGAPMPPALLARARALSIPLCTSWGMTEAASQVATQFAFATGDADDAGPPMPHVSVSEQGGTLCIDGLLTGGFIETADCGRIDAAGHVRVLGRRDDVLISGGENVPVEPIEAVLCAHPAIVDAAVVGVADATWGERPLAFVVAASTCSLGARPTDAQMLAFCRERLASFQRPVQFVWRDALPRDALGKLRRRALRPK